MINNDDESQKRPKDKENTVLPHDEEKEKKQFEGEGFAEKNPDVEDPRLYSSLQEPDRPAPSERATEEKEGSKDSPD